MSRPGRLFAAMVCALVAVPARAQPAAALEVAQAAPQGEVDALAQAAEVRVVFSEPMVALGRIPSPVTAPFFHVTPALPGTLRWSGTRTLVFTPADPDHLPYATRYEVTIDAGATSAAGVRLVRPFAFSFTTPTVRLLQTSWSRRQGRYDRAVVLLLRFNQPVSHASVDPHLSAACQAHAFTPPAPPGDDRARADPAAREAFEAKVARAREAAGLTAAVALRPTDDWDKKAFPPSEDLLAFETGSVPPAESWLRLTLGPGARGVQGTATPAKPQDSTAKLERTLFVDGFRCARACDPDGYNPLSLRGRVALEALRARVIAKDGTDPAHPTPLARAPHPAATEEEEAEEADQGEGYDRSSQVSLEDVGFTLHPARTYVVTVDASATASDGQTLGYTWTGTVENWHQRAFTSFGAGHGVWESAGGPTLPFYARNLATVSQWLAPLAPGGLVPTVRALQEKSFALSPPGERILRRLTPRADAIQSFGLDLGPVLGSAPTGLVWAAVEDGRALAKTPQDPAPKVRSSVVQVTNLGLSVKDSPVNTLALVTRLSDGEPVEGARVSIRTLDNAVFWSGFTDKDGLAAAPRTALRDPGRWEQLSFLVTAEKDGDLAYLGSDWTEGLEPWAFGLSLDLREARPLLRGTVFSDRGVYRLGEEAHLKAILRSDSTSGIGLLDRGTAVQVVVRDSQGEERDKRTVALSEWSSADWTYRLPEEAPLGHYEVRATVAGQQREVSGTFLVAAYRRPDFRVDANLAGPSSVAGVTLKGVIDGRYLFGATMAGRDVRWTYSHQPLDTVPNAIAEAFPSDRYVLLDEEREESARAPETVLTREAKLDAKGGLALDLETDLAAGRPLQYALVGEVTDLSRQTIAGRASFRAVPPTSPMWPRAWTRR